MSFSWIILEKVTIALGDNCVRLGTLAKNRPHLQDYHSGRALGVWLLQSGSCLLGGWDSGSLIWMKGLRWRPDTLWLTPALPWLHPHHTKDTQKILPIHRVGSGHPPKKNICQEDNCHPQFFSLFFLAHFSWLFRLTSHGGHQGWEGGSA